MPRPKPKPPKRSAASQPATPPSRQLAAFVAKYDPDVARLALACRRAVRKRLPTAFELVYDNYQFLAIGYSTTERTSDCLVSLAVSPKGVALSFFHGASLPDPDGILLGSGNQHRFVRLQTPAAFSAPAVEALIRAAIALAKTPLPARGRNTLIIKSVSAKQRPRRKPEKPGRDPAAAKTGRRDSRR